ncbi:MAG: glycosyltransferase family 39 protein, partial [Planctomycetes bacterium]|nr:glycosyltransferase family 39 protein [Planctomycetota bacterium]
MIDDSTSNRPTDRQAAPDAAAPEESRLPRPSPVSVATDISDSLRTPRSAYWILTAILLLFAVVSTVGITWGLPSRRIDHYLFADGAPWSGEKIYRLAHADEKFGGDRGADVDADPIQKNADQPVLLTGTDEDIAKIYLRYRLYTHQPDEMITMMALAGMRPSRLDFDPKLYQYGGLFIYPVGALIRLCGYAGLIDVRGDVVFYLDNPDEFGKFYVVARAYSAMWGLVGVVVVFAIARRLKDAKSGLLAALLFTLMPVVVCMAHEGKPHLPGAVLMLAAVLFAMRHLSAHATASALPRAAGFSPRDGSDARGAADVSPRRQEPSVQRDWWLMCVCCGAALGMVLSSWPIFVLIPLVAWLDERGRGIHARKHLPFSHAGSTALGDASRDEKLHESKPATYIRWSSMMTRTTGGAAVGLFVYLVANPYILINAVSNRGLLASNFGNSLAMYQISR